MQEDFISQITSIIEKNVDDEQFGVSELAEAVNMSRSNLLRKIKKQTELSASHSAPTGGESAARYNGNITNMEWADGHTGRHMYSYTYDGLSQLTQAEYLT